MFVLLTFIFLVVLLCIALFFTVIWCFSYCACNCCGGTCYKRCCVRVDEQEQSNQSPHTPEVIMMDSFTQVDTT